MIHITYFAVDLHSRLVKTLLLQFENSSITHNLKENFNVKSQVFFYRECMLRKAS